MTAPATSAIGDALQPVAKHWFTPDIGLPRFTPLAGGLSGAGVWKFDVDGQPWVLRCWPVASPPVTRLQALHRWLQVLKQEGCPVATPIPLQDCTETLLPRDGRWWQCEPFLPGVAVTSAELTTQRRLCLMEQLVQLHCVSRSRGASLAPPEFQRRTGRCPSVVERFELVKRWTPAVLAQRRATVNSDSVALAEAARRFLHVAGRRRPDVGAALSAVADESFTLFPCWRDLWSAHVLFQDDQISGFVDAGAARTDHPATDLSRLLGSYCGGDRELWAELLGFYETLAPFSRAEQRLIAALDLSGAWLSGLTWIERLERGAIPAANVASATERLRGFTERLDLDSL